MRSPITLALLGLISCTGCALEDSSPNALSSTAATPNSVVPNTSNVTNPSSSAVRPSQPLAAGAAARPTVPQSPPPAAQPTSVAAPGGSSAMPPPAPAAPAQAGAPAQPATEHHAAAAGAPAPRTPAATNPPPPAAGGANAKAEEFCAKYEMHCGYGMPMRHADKATCIADFNADAAQQFCKNMHMDTAIAGTAAACNGMPSAFCFGIHCLHATGLPDQTGTLYCK